MSQQQYFDTVELEAHEMNVYKAINKVQAELAHIGITKDRRNQQQGYNFRGIDDVYNVLSPLLAKHGLCILPRIVSRVCEERQSAKGGILFYVTIEAEFDFVCADDGSKHVVRTYGEAMDSGDKATNKAMSAAYKYAAFQAFAIPTEGDNDTESHTPEVESRLKPQKPTEAMPEGKQSKILDLVAAMADAPDGDTLKKLYSEAYTLSATDQVMQAKVITAKNKRKAELAA